MNGKTAKLLNRYAKLKDLNLKDLKREWYSLPALDRFKKRQNILADLQK